MRTRKKTNNMTNPELHSSTRNSTVNELVDRACSDNDIRNVSRIHSEHRIEDSKRIEITKFVGDVEIKYSQDESGNLIEIPYAIPIENNPIKITAKDMMNKINTYNSCVFYVAHEIFQLTQKEKDLFNLMTYMYKYIPFFIVEYSNLADVKKLDKKIFHINRYNPYVVLYSKQEIRKKYNGEFKFDKMLKYLNRRNKK